MFQDSSTWREIFSNFVLSPFSSEDRRYIDDPSNDRLSLVNVPNNTYQWKDLWESVGSTHATWIAGHPDATFQEYLESAHDQCVELSDFTIEEAQEEIEDEIEYWLGALPIDHDTDEMMEQYCDSIRENIDDVYCLHLIVEKISRSLICLSQSGCCKK